MSGVTALRLLLPVLAMMAMTGGGYADNARGSGAAIGRAGNKNRPE